LISSLDESQLNDTGVEGIKVIQDGVNLKILEGVLGFIPLSNDIFKVLNQSFSSAKDLRGQVGLWLIRALLKIMNVKTIHAEVVSKSLNGVF
jgi:hypothetical protein